MRKVKITARLVQGLKPEAQRYEVHDLELKGFYLRVTPSGKMTYYQTYFRAGRRERFSVGDARVLTVPQAKERAIQILADAARDKDPKAERKKNQIPSLLDFINRQYGPWVLENRKAGVPTLNHLKCPVYSEFHPKKITEITPWLIEKWRTQRRKSSIAFSTINRDVSRLRALLYKAIEWGVIQEHPFSKVKQYREDNLRKVRYLTHEEEVSLRQALDAREETIKAKRQTYNLWRIERGYGPYPDLSQASFADYLKPMVLISINTGLRRGELFNLHWNDVDLNQKILTVDGDRTKSGKTRYIPLNREAHEVFTAWKEQSEYGNKMVFQSKDGDKFTEVKSSWGKLLRDAKIYSFRWHDMRHHFASRLVMAGVDLNTVRELLGHSDLKMTLRYAHLSPEVKAQAVARLDIDRSSKSLFLQNKQAELI